MMSKRVLEQTACPNPACGSSDAFTVYQQEDGSVNAHCYSCEKYFSDPYKYLEESNHTEVNSVTSVTPSTRGASRLSGGGAIGVYSVDECLTYPVKALPERGISLPTCERYGVRLGVSTSDGATPIFYLFPRTRKGKLTGFVRKDLDPKNYVQIGDCSHCDPFGMEHIPSRGKKLFVTEGSEDALALYEVLKTHSQIDWEPAVVALLGAKGGISRLLERGDILDNYEEIIIALDQDEAGKEASERLAKSLAGKALHCNLL